MKRLFNLVSDHTFPTAPSTSVTSFASSFIKTNANSHERNATKEVLNCLRLLQRVLPVVFEVETDASRLELEVFWKREVVEEEEPHIVEPSAAQFVIEDEDEDEDSQPAASNTSPRPSQSQSSSSKKQKTLPSLAERLMSCLVDLLFCCGFTLPSKIQVDHHKINYTIWYVISSYQFTNPNVVFRR